MDSDSWTRKLVAIACFSEEDCGVVVVVVVVIVAAVYIPKSSMA